MSRVVATPAPRRPRRLAKKLLTLSITLAVLLGTLELVVRATWTDARYVTDDARVAPGVFSVRMKPNATFDFEFADGGAYRVETNARGFRGPLVASIAAKPRKIVSIGDSFTFGWGLALEQLATVRFVAGVRAAHPDRDLGHAIVATPGWGPREYLFAYQTEVAAVRPELVVLGFYADNDVMPPSTTRYARAEDAPSRDTIPPAPPRTPWRTLDWARVQFGSSLAVARLKLWLGVHAESYAIFERDVEKQKAAWDTTFFHLGALDAAVRAGGGRLVIVSYPSQLQVEAGSLLDEAGYDAAMPDRMLASFCREHAIELIPLLEPLRAADAGRNLYFRKDRHLNAQGHEVVTRVLTERLGPLVDALR